MSSADGTINIMTTLVSKTWSTKTQTGIIKLNN